MGKLLDNFGLDWKLLFAQAFNFVLVFWLLKRFAFSKLLAELEKRRTRIKEGLAMREQAEQEIARANQFREEEIQIGKKKASDLLEKAKALAKEKVKAMESEAHARGEEMVASAKAQAERQKQEILSGSKNEIAAFAMAALEKVLEKGLSKDSEERLAGEVTASLRRTHYAK